MKKLMKSFLIGMFILYWVVSVMGMLYMIQWHFTELKIVAAVWFTANIFITLAAIIAIARENPTITQTPTP